ncbi:MAG: hypothetical protein L3J42_05765, partial [Hydrogenimonas sp.]|nr:hypothetical protein [Hydrogenimonas sp.]
MRVVTKTAIAAIVIASSLQAFSIDESQEGIYNTNHNLLRGVIFQKDEEKPELCIWCHIPHDSLSGDTKVPKWFPQSGNENAYDVYGMDLNSSTQSDSPESGVMVRVCLTCHDGVNAPNISLYSAETPEKF